MKALKKIGSVILFITFLTSFNVGDSVYICKGKSATKYNCRGLSNCKTDVVKVTLADAKSAGKTLCGWED
jgi:hypothetical protein